VYTTCTYLTWRNRSCFPPREQALITLLVPSLLPSLPPSLLPSLPGLFAGLTLGFMGLDKIGLEIVMEAGDPESRRCARRIAPVRKDGNLLLCSLLFGNVAVNVLISILMSGEDDGRGGREGGREVRGAGKEVESAFTAGGRAGGKLICAVFVHSTFSSPLPFSSLLFPSLPCLATQQT